MMIENMAAKATAAMIMYTMTPARKRKRIVTTIANPKKIL